MYKVRQSENILFEFILIMGLVKFVDLIIEDELSRWQEKIILLIDKKYKHQNLQNNRCVGDFFGP